MSFYGLLDTVLKFKGGDLVHDWFNLVQIIGTIAIGLLTLFTNNKKNDRDYIKDQNDRLNKENKELKDENDRLRKELDKDDN